MCCQNMSMSSSVNRTCCMFGHTLSVVCQARSAMSFNSWVFQVRYMMGGILIGLSILWIALFRHTIITIIIRITIRIIIGFWNAIIFFIQLSMSLLVLELVAMHVDAVTTFRIRMVSKHVTTLPFVQIDKICCHQSLIRWRKHVRRIKYALRVRSRRNSWSSNARRLRNDDTPIMSVFI